MEKTGFKSVKIFIRRMTVVALSLIILFGTSAGVAERSWEWYVQPSGCIYLPKN